MDDRGGDDAVGISGAGRRQVGGRVGGSPVYASGGGVTRLQAGPFAAKAAAAHACSVARVTCVVVAP